MKLDSANSQMIVRPTFSETLSRTTREVLIAFS
jgi:hypothetical protein